MKNQFKIKGRIWISTENGTFLGEGRIELLKKIDEFGSISKAAKAMGMSYKKAWELVSSMNSNFSEALVTGTAGGLNGGGSALSDSGKELIQIFTKLNQENKDYLDVQLDKYDLLK